MSFTTWEALRSSIRDAIANQVSNAPCVGSVSLPDGKQLKYRDYEELCGLIQKTYILESLETRPAASNRVSYGGWRRFDRCR